MLIYENYVVNYGDRYTIILEFYTLEDLYYYYNQGFELTHWIDSTKAILEKVTVREV
jgi:uncharacterized protein (DUF2164 family)